MYNRKMSKNIKKHIDPQSNLRCNLWINKRKYGLVKKSFEKYEVQI